MLSDVDRLLVRRVNHCQLRQIGGKPRTQWTFRTIWTHPTASALGYFYQDKRLLSILCILAISFSLLTSGCRNEVSSLIKGLTNRLDCLKTEFKSFKGSERLSESQIKYRILCTELDLAESGQIYLILNLPQRRLEIRLRGANVWQTPLNPVEGDSQTINKFLQRFTKNSERWRRPITGKYLFASQEKMPDSVLTIVSEVLNVKKELLQREVPERFRIYWSDDLLMDIITDVTGQKRSFFKNKVVEAHSALRRPFGAAQLVVKLPPDDALTLYRLTNEGFQTLILP